MHIYAENLKGRDPAYVITESFLHSLFDDIPDVVVSVRWSDEPDLAALAAADIFVGGGFDHMRIARHASRVRLIHSTSAGVERYLPLDWLPSEAVFTNSSGIHREKAREYLTWALLALHAGLPRFAQAQQEHRWERRLTGLIAEKHLVVLGLGGLGSAVADAAHALGLNVTAVTRSGQASALLSHIKVVTTQNMKVVLPKADFLVAACPLTPATRGLIDADAIALLPTTASLINISRGPVVDTSALCTALREGRLTGAILDVFSEEPLLPESDVWDTPGLLVTPHISCDTPDYLSRSLDILRCNVRLLIAGEISDLKNVVDPHLGY